MLNEILYIAFQITNMLSARGAAQTDRPMTNYREGHSKAPLWITLAILRVMWRTAHVTPEWAGSSELRHAASVQSRTIMKIPSSAEAAADAHDYNRRHRASLPRLLEQHLADRWLEDPDQLFLSLNAEENGRARVALLWYWMRGECGKNLCWLRFCGVSALAAGMRVARCFSVHVCVDKCPACSRGARPTERVALSASGELEGFGLMPRALLALAALTRACAESGNVWPANRVENSERHVQYRCFHRCRVEWRLKVRRRVEL